MRNQKLLVLFAAIIAVVTVVGAKFLILDRQSPSFGALRIDAFPKTTVFLNDQAVGVAPYFDEKISPGEYSVKLLSAGENAQAYLPWEGKVKITSNTLTYINRNLAGSDDLASGQTLILEKLASEQSAELSVVSSPDGATISIDGLDSGKAPSVVRDISVGEHEIIVSADGYGDQVIRGKIIGGYRLNVVVKLAKLPFIQSAPTASLISSPSAQTLAKPYVVIKDTPTGFLRVRTDPDINASEAARVIPGEKYPLVSEQAGWVQIKLTTLSGWVSDQYVDKIK